MPQKYPTPIPVFDTLEYALEQQAPSVAPMPYSADDFKIAIEFLKQYDGSLATFNAYRREIERLLQWSWLIVQKSIVKLKRTDIEDYIKFCLKPPKSWIGLKQVTRFIERAKKDSIRITIIVAERLNEWNMSCEHLAPLVIEDFDIKYLSDKEINLLLDLLAAHDSLGVLKHENRDAQFNAFKQKAGRQLLVALYEATSGKPFEDIIVDEYQEIE